MLKLKARKWIIAPGVAARPENIFRKTQVEARGSTGKPRHYKFLTALVAGALTVVGTMHAEGSLTMQQVTAATPAGGLVIPSSTSNTEIGGITIAGYSAANPNYTSPAPSSLTLQGYTYTPYYDVYAGTPATYTGPTISHFQLSGPLSTDIQSDPYNQIYLPPSASPDTSANSGFTDGGTSPGETALLAIVNNGLFYRQEAQSTNTLTVSGLTTGNTYTVDILTSWIGYAVVTDETFTVTSDITLPSVLLSGGNHQSIFDVQYTGTADVNGDIIITETSKNGNGPDINAAIVTQSTPEPASISLLVLGFCGLLIRRRTARS